MGNRVPMDVRQAAALNWHRSELADHGFLMLEQLLIGYFDKGEAVPIQAWTVPGGFQEFKVPRFRDNGTGWWYVVSLRHRPPLPPGNTPGTHFC